MIIDASVALKWFVIEDGSDEANALLGRTDLLGPTLVQVEVANGLRKKAVRGQIASGADLTPFIETLATVIQPVDELPVMVRALAMATALNHSVYDCVYLALAEQLGQELVTADAKFLRKVEQSSWADLVRAL